LHGVRGGGREGEREDSKKRGDYATRIREQRYVSEPIETRYLKFLLLILLLVVGFKQLANWEEYEY
jgi:hypothetical protein